MCNQAADARQAYTVANDCALQEKLRNKCFETGASIHTKPTTTTALEDIAPFSSSTSSLMQPLQAQNRLDQQCHYEESSSFVQQQLSQEQYHTRSHEKEGGTIHRPQNVQQYQGEGTVSQQSTNPAELGLVTEQWNTSMQQLQQNRSQNVLENISITELLTIQMQDEGHQGFMSDLNMYNWSSLEGHKS
jgi:hypothetical protein